jgi:hypothetical protein
MRSFRQVRVLTTWPLFVVVAIAGCGQKLPANPKTYPVHGKVTLEGEPMTGGKVMFTQEGSNIEGIGKISKDGEYYAYQFVGQDGLMPGEYKIWLLQYGGEPAEVPEQYRSGATSGLTFTVQEEENTFDVDFE